MAAVVRLKRCSDEEPLEALVLACKRKKTEEDLATTKNETPFTTILKFAGTVNSRVNTHSSFSHYLRNMVSLFVMPYLMTLSVAKTM
jgi:hypothetical protein